MPAFNYGTVIQALKESVKRNLSDGLLLSGGLDTALLAYLASKWNKPSCITVALSGAPAPDIDYAKLIAKRLELSHYIHYFDDEVLDEAVRAVIRIRKTFDPMEVRNSAAIYVALKISRDRGLSTIMTGDGCDELFGGYSFLFGLTKEQLDVALRKMWTKMSFSSEYIAEDLGIAIRLPYLDPQFKTFATGLDVGLKIRREKGEVWGKWILRKAFENIVPKEILWRVKAPIEVGTGTTILPALFGLKISDFNFNQKKKKYFEEDRVVIRSKEHLHYYEIYKDLIGIPHAMASGVNACPYCSADIEKEASFCRTCGAYPVQARI